jgi:TRAP-type uncharacterized transport system fused permease subunit
MFVFYTCCLAPLTPPVAMACYTASSISGADPMKTAFKATFMGFSLWLIPFLIFRYGIHFGMETPAHTVVLFSAIGAVGCFTFISGSIGYYRENLKPAIRIVLVCLGLLCLQPLNAIVSGIAALLSLSFLIFLFIRHNQQRARMVFMIKHE